MSAAQRNGILFFILLLIGSLCFQYFWFIPNETKVEFAFSEEDVLELQEEVDSIKQAKEEASKPKIYPFNPNYLKDFKAYQLGITTQEFDRLKKFRDDGEWINSASDFQEVTQISDSLLAAIKPYFKFPDWVIAQQKRENEFKKYQSQLKTDAQKQNLNTATSIQLQEISGIGEVLAKRIVRRREKIGGFRSNLQLKDIWGLKYQVRAKLLEEFTVKLDEEPEKIDINKANVVQLTEVPYFDYELAREIVHFIKVREGITNFEELSKIYDFPSDKIDRIKLYLEINE